MTRSTRRDFVRDAASAAAAVGLAPWAASEWRFRWILASCMYGETALAEILPEVREIGATHLDVWPRVHGNQREQIDGLGREAFLELLREHRVKTGAITRYDLGPFGLRKELAIARELGASLLVTGSRGPKKLRGAELERAVGEFVETMKPHVEIAADNGVRIAIENHGNALIHTPDSIRHFAELADSHGLADHLGIALAPYHLPQDAKLIAALIRDLDDCLLHFYAWEHGKGAMKKLPKKDQLTQLPARGPLDFEPIVAALRAIDYAGWISVFMHPVPRGIPILATTDAVTAEINHSRRHLDDCLARVRATAARRKRKKDKKQ